MRVFLRRPSLCSVTLICCLMISAEVIGRLGLDGGAVNDIPEPLSIVEGDLSIDLSIVETAFGEDGLERPPLLILLEGERLSILSPSALFIRLTGVVTTPVDFIPIPDPPPSPLPFSWLE